MSDVKWYPKRIHHNVVSYIIESDDRDHLIKVAEDYEKAWPSQGYGTYHTTPTLLHNGMWQTIIDRYTSCD
jgi:hypothetical protein